MTEIYFNKGTYDIKTVCEVLNIDFDDAHHRARNIKSTLKDMGYPENGYKILRGKVEFCWTPNTPEEKIKYLSKLLNLNIKNIKGFAVLMYTMSHFEEYDCMPRQTVCDILNKLYNVNLNTNTVYTWIKKISQYGDIIKDKNEFRVWCTYYVEGHKLQTVVNFNDEVEVKNYKEWCNRRTELLKENHNKWVYSDSKGDNVMNRLWEEFQVCYYKCYSYKFNAWNENRVLEELFKEIERFVEVEERLG